MDKQQLDRAVATGTVSHGTQSAQWIAPLQSLETFSIAELTQIDSFPGDDGAGIFTQS